MASVHIKLHLHYERLAQALADACNGWSENRKNRFVVEWRALEAAGAEMVDVRFVKGVVQAFPSEDFTMHCAKWGVYPNG